MSFININKDKVNFKLFYKLCLLNGSNISKLTKERDVVLISKRTSFDQISCFIGAILYNRIPIIIPHPSVKVSSKDFLEKMDKINQVVSPKLCISDKEDCIIYSGIWKTVCEFTDQSATDIIKPKDNNEIAFIQLSSGTTGSPKVISVSHKSLIAQCDEYATQLGLTNNDVVVSWLPLYHDMGLIACFLMPLLKKISFVHVNPFEWLSNPQILFDKIEKFKGTHCWMPNFAFSYMAKRCKNSNSNLSSIKKWISCSEVSHSDDIKKFINTFSKNGVKESKISICYALAENVFSVSQSAGLLLDTNNVLSCGQLTPGTSVIIKDSTNTLITSNSQPGGIFIRSSYMADNLQTDEYGYYNTGDVGYFKGNDLYIMGRNDDMIISYGKNIFPYEIENLVSSMKDVISGRVACFGNYDNKISTEKVYLVAETNNKNIDKQTVKSEILKQFEISPECFFVENGFIVKTSSGKINRSKTKEKLFTKFGIGK